MTAMRAAIVSGVTALLLFIMGGVSWTAGRLERGLVDTRRELARLAYAESIKAGNEVERRLGVVGALPVTAATTAELREQRATAQYWLATYAALVPRRDAEGAPLERDPDLLFLAANAAYRSTEASSERQDRKATLGQLESVLKAYADVMKSSPGHLEAAYNYEYVARTRDLLTRPIQPPRARPEAPLGPPTIHGRPGGVPPGADMSDFKIMIPKQGEEKDKGEERNNDEPGATTGKGKARKG